jgi:short-subunit dehydrogenase
MALKGQLLQFLSLKKLIVCLGLAVIAGVGPGLGASLSRRFAKEYKVVLLARSQKTLDTVSESIKKNGGDVNSLLIFSKSTVNRISYRLSR